MPFIFHVFQNIPLACVPGKLVISLWQLLIPVMTNSDCYSQPEFQKPPKSLLSLETENSAFLKSNLSMIFMPYPFYLFILNNSCFHWTCGLLDGVLFLPQDQRRLHLYYWATKRNNLLVHVESCQSPWSDLTDRRRTCKGHPEWPREFLRFLVFNAGNTVVTVENVSSSSLCKRHKQNHPSPPLDLLIVVVAGR